MAQALAHDVNPATCKHCGLKLYLDKSSVIPTSTHWRHHGSNLRECYIMFAEPAKPAPDLEAIARKHFPPILGPLLCKGDVRPDGNAHAREACLSALKELMEACGK